MSCTEIFRELINSILLGFFGECGMIPLMDQLIEFIVNHSSYAPWMTFVLILLAGFNLPISIDVVMVLSAFLAATTIPEYTFSLYLSLLFGCYFSAWIAYWMGRKVGRKLLKTRYFSKILPETRLKKLSLFYERHGLLTLLIGRFIPFGVRSCIFITAGISKSNFGKFIRRDALACFIWTSVCFFSFYSIGQNYGKLIEKIKTLNLFIFLAFVVTVIIFVCYKMYRKKRTKALEKNSGL